MMKNFKTFVEHNYLFHFCKLFNASVISGSHYFRENPFLKMTFGNDLGMNVNNEIEKSSDIIKVEDYLRNTRKRSKLFLSILNLFHTVMRKTHLLVRESIRWSPTVAAVAVAGSGTHPQRTHKKKINSNSFKGQVWVQVCSWKPNPGAQEQGLWDTSTQDQHFTADLFLYKVITRKLWSEY